MTSRFHRCLVAIALVGLALLGIDPGVATSKDREHPRREHPRRPEPPVPEPVVDAWTAHAQRARTHEPAKLKRPDRLPKLKTPRLGQEPGTAVCTDTLPLPPPPQWVFFGGNDAMGGAGSWLGVHRYSPISHTYPCPRADERATFPSMLVPPDGNQPALVFADDAALVLASATPAHPVRYTFWGREPLGLPQVMFPENDIDVVKVFAVDVMSPRELYAAAASCPYCPLGDILVSATDQPTYNPVGATGPAYDRVHNLAHADLTGATLTGIFHDWDFSGANLTGANLTGVSFMKGAQLADANFSGATLDGALFDGVDLSGANFEGARWDPARPPRFLHVQVGRSASGGCTRLTGLDLLDAVSRFSFDIASALPCPGSPGMFRGSLVRLETVVPHLGLIDLTGMYVYVDATNRSALAGANLSFRTLDGVTLVGFPADLTGAVLDGASMIGASFDLADFAGATLHGVTATQASFRGARFSGNGTLPAASFAGATLAGADFVEADVSGASFAGATLTGAVFSRALARGTNFAGVSAANANFAEAHIYGDGQAFHQATTLRSADFRGTLLAAALVQRGGFDFTQADLTEAKFDQAQCIACDFAGATLTGASFTKSYLPGVNFADAQLDGATLFAAWLYCGDLDNTGCLPVTGQSDQWLWPLDLGLDEAFGPVPFTRANLPPAILATVTVCPDGKAGNETPGGCVGHLLPDSSQTLAIPSPCSAAGLGSCPAPVQTLVGNGTGPRPLATAPPTPAYWATIGATDQGLLVAFDDGTVRLVTGTGHSTVFAGTPGQLCAGSASCGDGGNATTARLGRPTGLSVDVAGAVYIADSATRRIRRVDVDGMIRTVAGSGGTCAATDACGDGARATAAELDAALDVWVDPVGHLWIADGPRGIRLVTRDGLIHTVPGTNGWNVVSVTGDVLGTLYAATQEPDHLLRITHDGAVSVVVGTGTSGFNGNTNAFGFLLPGTQVQINRPGGLAAALDGMVFFADSGNNLLRGYAPGSGHVVEVGGLITSGTPLGGFNGDGQAADETEFSAPADIALTGTGQFVVADTANSRVRRFAR